jgi:uncharacterized protein (DUF305 family)
MIPHHGQAVQMGDLILARTANPAVRALAGRINQAQTPEIATMSGWLKGWGAQVPDPFAAMGDGMAGMGSGGMMGNDQLRQLETLTGASADKLFLTLMVAHHQGALDVARKELAGGENPQAKTLAQAIVTGQSAEITEMGRMLTSGG